MRRRSLIGVSLSGALLAACTASEVPSPELSPVASPSEQGIVGDECYTLEGYEFRHEEFCGESSQEGDGDVERFEYFGQPVAGEGTVAAMLLNAVVEWDVSSGAPTRLLAPRMSDSTHFAVRGDVAVMPRCTGELVVFRDGCVVARLDGHQAPEEGAGHAVQGLAFVSDSVFASLGVDNTVRTWNVDGEQIGVQAVDSDPEGRTLWLDAAGERLVLNIDGGRRVETYDPQTLERLSLYPDLSPVRSGWRLHEETLYGEVDDEDAPGIVVIGTDGTSQASYPMRTPSTVLAVSSRGTLAYWDESLVIADAAGHRARIDTDARRATSLAFSPDGSLLIEQDGLEGLRTFDVATRERVATCRDPR